MKIVVLSVGWLLLRLLKGASCCFLQFKEELLLFFLVFFLLRLHLLCFDLLTRPKMPFKVMHRKDVTHSNVSYERKLRGRRLADEMGRGKKNPIILS